MKSHTDDKPKCLNEFLGTPLIKWQLDAFEQASIKHVAIVTGYKSHLLLDYSENCFHNPRWETSQMYFSLTHAASWLNSYNCIISYSDIFYTSNIIEKLSNDKSSASIAYDKNWYKLWKLRFDDIFEDAETFKLNKDNFLLEIGNKTKILNDIDGQFMGLIKFTPEAWIRINSYISSLPNQISEKIQMTQLINKCINDSVVQFKAIGYKDTWGEIDNTRDLELYERIYSNFSISS